MILPRYTRHSEARPRITELVTGISWFQICNRYMRPTWFQIQIMPHWPLNVFEQYWSLYIFTRVTTVAAWPEILEAVCKLWKRPPEFELAPQLLPVAYRHCAASRFTSLRLGKYRDQSPCLRKCPSASGMQPLSNQSALSPSPQVLQLRRKQAR